jgi:hypothetical protein
MIRHEIAGEPDSDKEDTSPAGAKLRRNSSATHEGIAAQAAQEVLKKIASHEGERGVNPSASSAINNNSSGEAATITAEELRIKELKKQKKKRYQENKKRKWH